MQLLKGRCERFFADDMDIAAGQFNEYIGPLVRHVAYSDQVGFFTVQHLTPILVDGGMSGRRFLDRLGKGRFVAALDCNDLAVLDMGHSGPNLLRVTIQPDDRYAHAMLLAVTSSCPTSARPQMIRRSQPSPASSHGRVTWPMGLRPIGSRLPLEPGQLA